VYWMLKRREAFDVQKLFGAQVGWPAPQTPGDLTPSCRSRRVEKERGARGASSPVSAPGTALGSVPTVALSSAQAKPRIARKPRKATTGQRGRTRSA
jgi:hypothetical protein